MIAVIGAIAIIWLPVVFWPLVPSSGSVAIMFFVAGVMLRRAELSWLWLLAGALGDEWRSPLLFGTAFVSLFVTWVVIRLLSRKVVQTQNWFSAGLLVGAALAVYVLLRYGLGAITHLLGYPIAVPIPQTFIQAAVPHVLWSIIFVMVVWSPVTRRWQSFERVGGAR